MTERRARRGQGPEGGLAAMVNGLETEERIDELLGYAHGWRQVTVCFDPERSRDAISELQDLIGVVLEEAGLAGIARAVNRSDSTTWWWSPGPGRTPAAAAVRSALATIHQVNWDGWQVSSDLENDGA